MNDLPIQLDSTGPTPRQLRRDPTPTPPPPSPPWEDLAVLLHEFLRVSLQNAASLQSIAAHISDIAAVDQVLAQHQGQQDEELRDLHARIVALASRLQEPQPCTPTA